MNPQIILEIGADLSGKSQSEARRTIEDYFARICWSLEKAEWEKMSEAQKAEFVRRASNSSAR